MAPKAADRNAERGARFLIGQQSADGLWRDFNTHAGEATDWPSAWILLALWTAQIDGSGFDRSLDALLNRQHADGGWGYHSGVPTDADSTAAVLLVLSAVGGHCAAASRAADCLVRHQNASGGIATYRDEHEIRAFMRVSAKVSFKGWCAPNVDVTARAGRALLSAGEKYASAAYRAWSFVREKQMPGGMWDAYWWVSPFYATEEAAAFAIAVNDRRPAERAAEWISKTLSGVAVSDTFMAALGLRILTFVRAPHEVTQPFVDAILGSQRVDGGWTGASYIRIPPPHILIPGGYEQWRNTGIGTGVVTYDQNGLFTTALAVTALCARILANGSKPWI